MRTNFFITIICLGFGIVANAQIKVLSSGSVGIGGIDPIAPLHVNGNAYIPGGSSYWINSLNDNGVRLRLHINGASSYIDFYPDLCFRTGYSSSGLSNSPLYLKYGCVGINNGNPTCALDVAGVIHMNGQTISSDERLKDNIKSMSGSLSSLTRLRGVTYKLKAIKATPKLAALASVSLKKGDSINYAPVKLQGLDSVFYNRNHIGFLAQEIQAVYPELVYADKNGILSVDYISLIPVIVEALKEQESKNISKDSIIESLNKKIMFLQKTITSQEQSLINIQNQINDIRKNCCGAKTKSAIDNDTPATAPSNTDIALYQNAPNPFTQTTEIKFSLPKTIKSASLYIFDMQGSIIKSIAILTRGNGSVTINGSELKAGMYLYSLIADGKETDTKRMILTQ